MAAATFAERIALDLALLVADATIIDLSRQRDGTAGQLTTRTVRVTEMAAAKVESVLGDVGAYDDTISTQGDQAALDVGIRMALYYYSQIYTLTLTDAGVAALENLLEELDTLAKRRRQANATPVVDTLDNDAINARHDSSVWDDDDDVTTP